MRPSNGFPQLFLAVLLLVASFHGPALCAKDALDLPMDLEKEQEQQERIPQDNQQDAANGMPDLGVAPEAQGNGQNAPAAGAPDLPPMEAQNRPATGSIVNAQHAATFGEDEDFMRGQQDALVDSNEEDSPHGFHFALVGQIGTNNLAQYGFDVEFTVSRHWSLGILGIYGNYTLNSADTLAGDAATQGGAITSTLQAATVSYYSRRPYEGIWIQGGLGIEIAKVSGGTTNDTAIPVFFNIGWRFLSDSRNLTFGVGIGPRLYLLQSSATLIPLVLTVDLIGVAWNIWPH